MASYAIPSKLHFTRHPMTMLNVRSWIVHLTRPPPNFEGAPPMDALSRDTVYDTLCLEPSKRGKEGPTTSSHHGLAVAMDFAES